MTPLATGTHIVERKASCENVIAVVDIYIRYFSLEVSQRNLAKFRFPASNAGAHQMKKCNYFLRSNVHRRTCQLLSTYRLRKRFALREHLMTTEARHRP